MRIQKVVTLDEKDVIMLKMLQKDGRTSFTNLAQKTGLSDVAVKKRIISMKKHGIIKKFSVIIRSDIDLEKDLNVVSLEIPSDYREPKDEKIDDCD